MSLTGVAIGIHRIQDASDFDTILGAGVNGYALTYQHSTGSFVLSAAGGGGGGTNDHAALINLAYANAAHTGFAGTGVSNTFTQNQVFSLDVTIGDDLIVTDDLTVQSDAAITGNVGVGGIVDVVGAIITDVSLSSPLLTSEGNTNITLNPGGTGNVLLDDTTSFRSATFDSSFPIGGFKIGPTGVVGQFGLTIGDIQADALHVRTFVADEVRVDRGDEYWTKSYGLTNDAFTAPGSIGGTVSVTFEDSAALTGAIASENDYVLFRTINISTGLDIYTCWGQLTSYVDNGNGTQTWTFTLRSGNTGIQFATGALGTIFGASGAAYIHLSVIDSAGAPYIKMRKWITNPYQPGNHTTYLQLGNLGSTGNPNYSPVGHGLYARAVASTGQFIVLDDNGFQIRGADFEMYSGANQTVDIASTNGSLKLGTNVINAATTGFTFDGATGNVTIGGASYSPTVTVYGVIAVKAGSSGYSNITDKPTALGDINAGEGSKLSGIAAGATVGATWGTNLNSIPTRFGDAPGSAGLYLTATHLGFYDGAAWKAWIASSGNFYFGGDSGAHLEWNGSKLRGLGTDGTTEQWYAQSSDGMLYAGAGNVRLSSTGIIVKATTGSTFATLNAYRITDASDIEMGGMYGRNYNSAFSIGIQSIGDTTRSAAVSMTAAGSIASAGAALTYLEAKSGSGAKLANMTFSVDNSSATLIIGGADYTQFNTEVRGSLVRPITNLGSNLGSASFQWGAVYAGIITASSTTSLQATTVGNGLTVSSGTTALQATTIASGLTVTSSGLKVSGGNTAIGNITAGRLLDVADRIRLRTGDGTAGLWLSDVTPTDRVFIGLYNDGASSVLGIYNGGAFQFFLDSSGQVGIGTTPSTKLHVHGGDGTSIRISTSTYTTGIDIGYDASSCYLWNYQNVPMLFATNGNERMRIDNGGKVTIGLSPDPNWQFNVLGGGGQLSFNPGFSGTNYISSYIGANTPGPLALFGSKVFVAANTFGIDTARTITNATDAGTTGDICWNSTHLFICVASSTWKRVAISTW